MAGRTRLTHNQTVICWSPCRSRASGFYFSSLLYFENQQDKIRQRRYTCKNQFTDELPLFFNSAVGGPDETHRSGFAGERKSSEMNEPCHLRRGEEYAVCDETKGYGCHRPVLTSSCVNRTSRAAGGTVSLRDLVPDTCRMRFSSVPRFS